MSLLRTLSWGVVVFDLLILGFAAWTVGLSRRQHVERAEKATHTLAQVLEQNLVGMVNQIDLALLTVKDEAERPLPGRLEERVGLAIRAQMARVPILDTLRTVDAQGWVGQAPELAFGQRVGVQDRDYFQHLSTHPGAGLFISRPALGRISGKWVVFFARRLERPDGAFQGLVYATVSIDTLVKTLSQVEVGTKGSISLRGSRFELLARFPWTPDGERLLGIASSEQALLDFVQSGRSETRFTTKSSIDGQVRTYTLRRLRDPGYFVLVGLAQADYLQAWRQEATLSALAVAGLLLLSLAIVWMARSAWNQQISSQVERDRLIEELTLAMTEVKNLKGMLPICGQCKKIRDDQGYWTQMEAYLSKYTDATFSHGVCPDCAADLRREILVRREQREASGTQEILPPT